MKKLIAVLLMMFFVQISFAQTSSNADTSKTVAVFVENESMPLAPYDLQKYLSDSLRYPKMEREAGKEGIVYISMVVEKDGSITNVMVKKSSGFPGMDREAVRVISSMPDWKPGMMNGRAVRVEFIQPVKFVLQDSPKTSDGK